MQANNLTIALWVVGLMCGLIGTLTLIVLNDIKQSLRDQRDNVRQLFEKLGDLSREFYKHVGGEK